MTRQTKKTTDLTDIKREKSQGFFQKIFFWIVIPLMFASALFLIVAKFADVNVFDKMSELSEGLPFVGEREKDETGFDEVVLEERVVMLQAEIQEKEAQVTQLQQELETSADEKEALLVEQEKLLDEIAKLKRQGDDSKQKFKEVVLTFERMSAKSAAPVITNMDDAEAIQILTNLKPDTLAAILEKMPAEDAAKYTTIMAK